MLNNSRATSLNDASIQSVDLWKVRSTLTRKGGGIGCSRVGSLCSRIVQANNTSRADVPRSFKIITEQFINIFSLIWVVSVTFGDVQSPHRPRHGTTAIYSSSHGMEPLTSPFHISTLPQHHNNFPKLR